MRVEAYEQLVKNVMKFENQDEKLRTERDTAAAHQQVARRQLSDIVALAAADPSKAQEVVIAQANLTIAEERLRQAEKKPANSPDRPVGVKGSYFNVQREIQRAKQDGSLFVEFQPLLDDLDRLRQEYLEKYRALLFKKDELNSELGAIQTDALLIEGRFGGRVDTSFSGPEYVATSNFRKWVWIGDDYRNAVYDLEQSLRAKLPPTPTSNVRTIPAPPKHTYGQREIPLSVIRSTSTAE